VLWGAGCHHVTAEVQPPLHTNYPQGLKITFTKVPADSRCPIDAVCVWAGDGEVALKAQQLGRDAALSLHTMLDPRSAVFNGFRIELVHLTPVRRASEPVAAKDYVAQLVVTAK
jgi:hypothetical protein